jgi:hypothetical protein
MTKACVFACMVNLYLLKVHLHCLFVPVSGVEKWNTDKQIKNFLEKLNVSVIKVDKRKGDRFVMVTFAVKLRQSSISSNSLW